MKTLNIDEYLNERSLDVQIGGKSFKVKDLPLEARTMMRQDDPDQKEIVKKILGCEDKDLEGYGVAAFAAIINQVTENLFRPSSQSGQSES